MTLRTNIIELLEGLYNLATTRGLYHLRSVHEDYFTAYKLLNMLQIAYRDGDIRKNAFAGNVHGELRDVHKFRKVLCGFRNPSALLKLVEKVFAALDSNDTHGFWVCVDKLPILLGFVLLPVFNKIRYMVICFYTNLCECLN